MAELVHINERSTFTQRMLASLLTDMRVLNETVQRLTVQIETLAAEHDAEEPAWVED